MAESDAVRGTIPNSAFSGLEYRCIGPHRGGRVVAVAGHPREPMTFYFGAVAGGLWRTVDGGTFWECITDGWLKTSAVGAVAVSESDPNVIYIGMGESTIRGDVSHGDGVYRSTDAGKTWSHLGLDDTRHISKVRVHPSNSDVVYVAALGHAWGPNRERGVYRTRDGGKTWEHILFRSERAGAIDLTMDPNNPRILYAAMWEAQRTPYSMWSGGPDSSLYRSTDGGDTWTDITRNDGLPKGVLGKIGVAVSPARADRVWALVEAEDGALFRSDDGGETWTRVSDNPDLRRRAWYYMHVFADPQDAESMWVLNLGAWKSTDGGVTFTGVPTPHGDNHDLWIDPQNPLRMIEGNDGGACVSFNGGRAWTTILNQPTAQFYHVIADEQVPYRLYGSQQDNTAISVPSMSPVGAITETDWFVPGGGESGYIAVRPDNPNIQYAGDHHGRITRHDRVTGQQRIINVWPNQTVMYEGAESQKYRFNWTFPLFLSPFDPNVLYTAANVLLKTTNEGTSWDVISPDLTRNDPSTLGSSGGPITRDNTSAEFYGTIFAAVESPHEQGCFWVGSDDGLVHLSRDGGESWEDITPADLKSPSGEWALISIIEVSPHDPATAYIAATRYKLDDNRPYLYKTDDYGKTWTKITNGIPEWDFTRVIREDPDCRGLLYAGTESALYVSFDDGEHWEPLQSNLPICPIHDLIVYRGDLIVGTHGRSFWILDDISPLHAIAKERAARPTLFPPRETIRFKIYEGFGGGEGQDIMYRIAGPVTYAFRMREKADGSKEMQPLTAGRNPANGALITYYLPEKPKEQIVLTILDAGGNEVRRFTSKKAEPAGTEGEEGKQDETAAQEPVEATASDPEVAEGTSVDIDPEADEEVQAPFVPAQEGINRFVWNFRAADAVRIPNDKRAEFMSAGPPVPPGEYRLQLQVGEETLTAPLRIVKDPRVDATPEDFAAQYELGLRIRDTMSRVNEAIILIRDTRDQLEGWDARLARAEGGAEARKHAKELIAQLTAIEEEFMNTKATGRMPYPPPNVPTRLNQKLAMLGAFVASADAVPTKQEYGVFDELSAAIEEQLTALERLATDEIPAFNEAVQKLAVPAIVPRERKATSAEQ